MGDTMRDDEIEIDLREVFAVLKRKIIPLILCLILGAGVSFGITRFLITPQYTSASMIYIFSKTTSITSLADLQIGSQLTVDFKTIGMSRPVIEKVIKNLNLDTTYEKLQNTITIENPSDSRILKIKVTNADPALACSISNEVASVLAERVAEVIDTDKPSTVEEAVAATAPSSPSLVKNVALGGLIGLLLAAAVILIRYFGDTSIKNEDDVRRYLGLNTLASIPLEHRRSKMK